MRIECKQFKIEKIENLKPHPNNLNKHSQKQIETLAKIIARNGQRSPIICSTLSGFIVKGHGRFEAIKLLGWPECAIEYQDYKDEVEELRDRVADNQIARYAEFDKEKFNQEIMESGLDFEELDFEEFGLIDFKTPLIDFIGKEDNKEKDSENNENKKFILQVNLPNELELRDLYDDLISKGYIVKEL